MKVTEQVSNAELYATVVANGKHIGQYEAFKLMLKDLSNEFTSEQVESFVRYYLAHD